MTQMVSAALVLPPVGGRTRDAPMLERDEKEGAVASGSFYVPPRRPQEFPLRSWPLQPASVRLARLHARTFLSVTEWGGDQEAAVRIVMELVDNAVQHVGPVHPQGQVTLGMTATEDDDLIIAVTDPGCWFDGFDGAEAAQKDSGLGLVRKLGGEMSWTISESGYTKTVRVLMKPLTSAF